MGNVAITSNHPGCEATVENNVTGFVLENINAETIGKKLLPSPIIGTICWQCNKMLVVWQETMFSLRMLSLNTCLFITISSLLRL